MNTPHAHSLHPAYLFLGPHATTLAHAQTFVKDVLCPFKGCNKCTACRHVDEKQHHAIVWLEPEKQYNLEALEGIFERIAFALEPDSHVFFILQKADTLTAACANRLLKSLEEPPAGYHFLLLAHRAEFILPTIRSRCIVHALACSANHNQQHALFKLCSSPSLASLAALAPTIEQHIPDEQETLALADALLAHWLGHVKTALLSNDEKKLSHAQRMVNVLQKAMLKPPMPGSGKIFWKNLLMQMAA